MCGQGQESLVWLEWLLVKLSSVASFVEGPSSPTSIFSISLSLGPSPTYPILLEPTFKVIPNKVLVYKDVRF